MYIYHEITKVNMKNLSVTFTINYIFRVINQISAENNYEFHKN